MNSPAPSPVDDPYDLARFVEAQESVYPQALEELRRGRKETHWMWFVFPQLAGLGTSFMATRYALQGLDEARAYLEHPVLGPRLRECCRAILSLPETSAHAIFGSPDDLKLRSSVTLFSQADAEPSEFAAVLDRFFGSSPDTRTLERLRNPSTT